MVGRKALEEPLNKAAAIRNGKSAVLTEIGSGLSISQMTRNQFNSLAEHFYRNSGNAPLLEMLDLDLGGNALDVGCGAGDNARLLAARGWNVSGITLSDQERKSAEPVCSRVWVHNLEDGLPNEANGPYDLVILSHVLEHLTSPEVLLRQIRQVLGPTGRIAVAVPNVLNWHQRLLFLAGRFEYQSEGIMDSTHLRFYTFASARRMVEGCGFRVTSAKAAGSILPWGRMRRWAPSLTSSVDRAFCRIRPGLFGRQLLYAAAPRSMKNLPGSLGA